MITASFRSVREFVLRLLGVNRIMTTLERLRTDLSVTAARTEAVSARTDFLVASTDTRLSRVSAQLMNTQNLVGQQANLVRVHLQEWMTPVSDAVRKDVRDASARLTEIEEQLSLISAEVEQLSSIVVEPLAVNIAGLVKEAAVSSFVSRIEPVIRNDLPSMFVSIHKHLDSIVQNNLTTYMQSLHAHIDRVTADMVVNLIPNMKEFPGLEIDRWKIREFEGLLRFPRKQAYLAAVCSGELPVPILETNYPLAAGSQDTLHPKGAKNDNSVSLRFNRKLAQLLSGRSRLKVLDLGCAGGGMVRSFIDEGHLAVGLEGSDYPKLNQTGEWGTIPQHLHSCDITRPFTIRDQETGEVLKFDAITAWEVMEHIPESDLPQLLSNIMKHLAKDGIVLFSIAVIPDEDKQTGAVWHQTIQAEGWWLDFFCKSGFEVVQQNIIGRGDWLRGSGNCRLDYWEELNLGFHVALRARQEIVQAA